jgi:hypothetical protein
LGSKEEPGRGVAGLVRVDLGVGQPGVIIHRCMDEPMADQRMAVAAPLAA